MLSKSDDRIFTIDRNSISNFDHFRMIEYRIYRYRISISIIFLVNIDIRYRICMIEYRISKFDHRYFNVSNVAYRSNFDIRSYKYDRNSISKFDFDHKIWSNIEFHIFIPSTLCLSLSSHLTPRTCLQWSWFVCSPSPVKVLNHEWIYKI